MARKRAQNSSQAGCFTYASDNSVRNDCGTGTGVDFFLPTNAGAAKGDER